MSDSQKFPVAIHALAYLAHKGAFAAKDAISSQELAASMPTNPVVVRRVTAMLGKAGLVGSRTGADGGAWLIRAPDTIQLDAVLRAVDGCTSSACRPRASTDAWWGRRSPMRCAAPSLPRTGPPERGYRPFRSPIC